MNDQPTLLLIKLGSHSEPAFPLGLAQLVPHARAAGWNVLGCDMDFMEFSSHLPGIRDGKIHAIGISLMSHQEAEAASLIRRIRALNGRIPVLLGGAHPTLFPKKALRRTKAHAAQMGDGERGLADNLAFLLRRDRAPQSLAVRNGDDVTKHGSPRHEMDLDSLPFADRTFLPLRRYATAYRSHRYPFASMITSRGCSERCPHCPGPRLHPHGIVTRSPERVFEEMTEIARDHSIRCFHFEDDGFFSSPSHAWRLAEELAGRKAGYTWELVNGVRPRQVDPTLFPLLARAGLRRMALGIERLGRPEESGLVHSPDEIRALLKLARRHGIETTGYFMLGLPGVSRAMDEESVAASRTLGLNLAHYSVYEPIPGSAWEDEPFEESDRRERLLLATKAYRAFYLKPGHVLRLSSEIALHPALGPRVLNKGFHQVWGTGTSDQPESSNPKE